MYNHKKIVLTGGPCAGKTSAMQKIVQEFTEKGYKVFVVCETATELIDSGIKPFGDKPYDLVEFQNLVLDLQLTKEAMFEKVANSYDMNTIILCDRGIMDSRAYINDDTFKKLLDTRGLNEMQLMASYDLVLHLVTAADGALKYYTCENNKARSESPEEAIIKDKKTLDAWVGHKRIEIIGNEGSFDDKLHNVIKCIYEELGEPYPIQKQYKFLVDTIDFDKLFKNKIVKLELEQFFTESNNEGNIMVRKTTKDGNSSYSSTRKIDTNILSETITTSRNISEREYIELFNTCAKPIKKCRYCFTYNKQYYHLDVFEEPHNLTILEVELTNKNKKVSIPDFISVQKDITDDIEYRNASIYAKINGCKKECLLAKKKTNIA